VSWLIALLLGCPALVLAFPVGPFEITPELTLEQRYDSNIFLRQEGEQSERSERGDQDDFITLGSLNLKVALPLRLTRARRIIPSVSFFAGAAAFVKNPDQNFQNQGISGGLDLDIPLTRPDERLTFNVSNSLRTITELTGSAEQSDIGPRSDRTENLLTADVGYFLTRRDELHLFYNRLDINQKKVAQFLDRNENTIGITYFRRISPRFSGLVEYDFKFVNFTNLQPEDPDFSSSSHIVVIGLRGDPTARLSGTLKVGGELRQIDHQRDLIRPFASSTLGYQITPRLSVNLLATRAILESTNQEFAAIDANIVTLRFTHQFTAKIAGSVEGLFELDEFSDRTSPGEPQRRLDRLYGVGAGGQYQFARWLRAGLSYAYRTKDSTLSSLDYVDNQVILRFISQF
jgi:Putative beta-barrel porin 2